MEEKKSTNNNSSAVNRFLNSYQTAGQAEPSRWAEAAEAKQKNEKTKKRVESKPKKEKGRGGMIAIVAILCALAAIAVCFFALQNNFEQEKNDTAASDLSKYQILARSAASADKTLETAAYSTPVEALEAFVALVNTGAASDWEMSYKAGKSFAEGKLDPWGTPYYITALQTGKVTDNTYLYEFYITCAGKNGLFDTLGLLLDADDTTVLLLAMQDYYKGEGEHSFLDPDTIQSSTSQTEEIPISFDTCGGIGGTLFVEAAPGDILPDIEVPEMDGFRFLGYFEFPNGVGIKYYDENGFGCVKSPFVSGTTLYAAWIERVELELPENQEEGLASEDGVGFEAGEDSEAVPEDTVVSAEDSDAENAIANEGA